MFIGLEPGRESGNAGNAECERLCRAIDFMPYTLICNRERLGIRGNPYGVLQQAFSQGSLLNIYLEDDLVVSPDVADLALWYARTVPDDALHEIRVMFMSLFVTSTGEEPDNEIVASDFFSPWGLVMNRCQWVNHIEPAWWNDNHRYPKQYDWTLSLADCLRYPLMILVPRCSRTTNIGREGGIHSRPERHDLLMGGLTMNTDPGPFEYQINPLAHVHWRRVDYQKMVVIPPES